MMLTTRYLYGGFFRSYFFHLYLYKDQYIGTIYYIVARSRNIPTPLSEPFSNLIQSEERMKKGDKKKEKKMMELKVNEAA